MNAVPVVERPGGGNPRFAGGVLTALYAFAFCSMAQASSRLAHDVRGVGVGVGVGVCLLLAIRPGVCTTPGFGIRRPRLVKSGFPLNLAVRCLELLWARAVPKGPA